MKYALFGGLMALLITGLISGCTSMGSANSKVNDVKITKGSISKNCKMKGHVAVTDQTHNMSTPSQHSSLKEKEFYQLREQAVKLGANTVRLSPSSGISANKHWATKTQHSKKATHNFAGDAYWCPAS